MLYPDAPAGGAAALPGADRGPGGGSAATDGETLWTAVVESSSDGLAVVSPDGRILAANRRFGDIWGLPRSALESGLDEHALAAARRLVVDPDGFLERVHAIYADPARPTHDEVMLRDGRVLDRYGTPLRAADGTYMGWAWHFRDITRQKAVEADLRRLADTLQSSLLPPRPPAIPGLEVATRYRPAHDAITVGGDFYDVFRLRTNDWGLVLGDVCGKGVEAARLTALARYSVRSAAGHHEDPSDVLRELNETLLGEADLGERFASAVYGLVELDVCGAWITLGVAGHPLPIVVRRAGWIDTRGQPGSLLGLFDDIEIGEDRVGLGPGDAILLCTDGVTEARNAKGEEYGDEALPEVLLAHASEDADSLADAVLDGLGRFAGPSVHDDVALLIIRVPADAGENPQERLLRAIGVDAEHDAVPGYAVGEPHWGATYRPKPPREARRNLGGQPASAADARRFVSGVLHSWRLSEVADGDVALLTSELVGNAIRHGETPFTVIVRYDGAHVRVEVGDGSAELPQRQQPAPDATSGRGVQLVDRVAADWGVTRTVEGKRVWFELPVPSS